MALYAFTEGSYRAISDPSDVVAGEQVADEVPETTLIAIRRSEVSNEIRARIAATNWAMMEDADLTTMQKTAIRAYRAALRALPDNQNFPNITWPDLPVISGVGNETGEQS